MKLEDSDIKQFQSLYLKHFNKVLSDDEARAELLLMVRQMEIVYQPITIEQFNKLNSSDDNNGRPQKLLS